LIAVLKPGQKEPKELAPGADITTDLPKYHIYRRGTFEKEVTNIKEYWQEDLVTFLIGCSFSFEHALLKNDVPVRNIEQGKNVSMFNTNIKCEQAGPFNCNMVVSYRPIPKEKVETAKRVTKECGAAHGPPVHIGDPKDIGIQDLNKPDYGDAVKMESGDVPVFWACGVTSTVAALSAKGPLVITHAPGHMFVSDKRELQMK